MTRTVYIDYGGTLDTVTPAEAWHLYARLRVASWRPQCWSAAPEGVPAEWAAIVKDLHLLEPGDVMVDDDVQMLRCARRGGFRGIAARDLLRLPELLKEEGGK